MIFWALFYSVLTPILIYYHLKNNVIKKRVVDLIDQVITCFSNYPSIQPLASFFAYALEAVAVVLVIQIFYFGHFVIPTGSMEPVIMPRDHYIVNMFKNKFLSPKVGEIYILKSPLRADKERLCKRLAALPGEKIEIIGNRLFVNDSRRFDRDYVNHHRISLIGNSAWIVPKKGDVLTIEHALFMSKDRILDINEAKELYKQLGNKFFFIYTLDSANFILNGKLTGPIFEERVIAKLLKEEKIILDEDYYFFLGDNTEFSKDSRKFGFISRRSVRGELRLRIWPLERFKFLNKD